MNQNAATYNATLSMYAQAAVANQDEALASILFPPVQVPTRIGDYQKRDFSNSFRVYDTKLSRDNSPRNIMVNATKAYFDCAPQGLDVSTWAFDTQGEGGTDWREDNLRELLSTQLISRDAEALRIFRAAVSATSGAGTGWSSGSGDPIKEIDASIKTINYAIGKLPNKIIFGLDAWIIAKNHASVRGMVQGLSTVASQQMFAEMLINPQIEIKVAALPYTPAKLGKSANKTGMVGSDIFVFYSDDSPTRNDVSAGKDFTLDAGGPEVHTIEDQVNMKLIDRLLWSSDMQVTCPAAAGRIVVS